jgi:predicted DNA-binding protein
MGKDGKNAVRVTTTLTKQQYEALEQLAKKNGVAIAWLIRRAVEHAIEEGEGGPLLPLVYK